jgi:hypothetical protein
MEAIIIFILSFLGINFLIFTPNFLVSLFSKIDHPKKSFFNDSPYFILKKIIYQRFSDDCFRLIFEIQVLTLLLLLINGAYLSIFKIALNIIILFSFIYITYISVIIKVFKKEPMLINDINFAKTGVMVYKKKIPVALLSVIIVLIGVFLLGNSLINTLITSSQEIKLLWPLVFLLSLSIIISLLSIKKVNYNFYHGCVSFSFIKHVILNLKKCKTLKTSLKNLNQNFPYEYIKNLKLKEKPNIVLIFLESYGSFAFSN